MSARPMSHAELILKTTPPRVPRTVLERTRFSRIWDDVHDRTAVAVVAPPGYGKTTLLSQWRRQWLAQGACVAWLSADGDDCPARFGHALRHALRSAGTEAPISSAAADAAAAIDGDDDADFSALTRLLADIADRGQRTVVVIDDVERLPEATFRHSLAHLLGYAPANLHLLLGSRTPLPQPTADLAARGDIAVFGTDDLRLQLAESVAILERRFGKRLSLDECVRLHEATQGWAVGLQLAVAAIEPAADLSGAVGALSGRHDRIERWFAESLFAGLAEPLATLLPRIAILDRLDAAMCRAVTGRADALACLQQLARETPVLLDGDAPGWFRIHPLARDVLRGRFERLPAAEQADLHRRASRWFAAHSQFPEAAAHALAAGDEALATTHAMRSLSMLRTQGRTTEAQAWLQRIPPVTIAGDVQLRLTAAWAMATGARNDEAYRIALDVLGDEAADTPTRFAAALVGSSATGYSDRIGLVPDLFAQWSTLPAGVTEPVRVLAYRNGLANLKLQAGRTGEARQLLILDPTLADDPSARLALAFRSTLIGLSHLWDADACRAEAVLRPALREAERHGGRRDMVACLHAAVLAAAVRERGHPDEAAALLADRLDVIENTGLPDTILLAYRTLARVALDDGDERRALSLLADLDALAGARALPRLRLHSLAEQVRVHALQHRHETVAQLLVQIDALAEAFAQKEFLPYLTQYHLFAAIARTHAAIAGHDSDVAEAQITIATACAHQLNRQRETLTVKVLRAVLGHGRRPAQSLALLAEAESLATIGGCSRLLADTHPAAMRLLASAGSSGETPARPLPPAPARIAAQACGPLTAKEMDVLRLLERGLANKQIARVLQIGDETVKWHLKNLFLKLAAGSRKHAVDRARLLGLL